eukprot:gene10353-13869_t
MPPLGIMVEVPAVAIHPRTFAEVAFFSIGSNDLTQYVMAAGRDNGAVADLNDTRNPAVLSLIRTVVAFANENAIPISLCGDAGSDPAVIPALLRAGLRALSMAKTEPAESGAENHIHAYKLVLSRVLETRPSGTRQRLADALGKHRSFITQMTSASYATPIPQRHLATLFSVCHF